jgi:MoxR-like ATPase
MENNISINSANYEFIPKLFEQIEKVIIGKQEVVRMLIAALLSGGHVLIEDVPGTGKTTLAMTLAKATSLSCRRVQFTPDVMASDITGFTMYNKENERFEYREGLVMSNIFIADEINRTSPKTQSALLQIMEESKVTVDGNTYELPDPFVVIATQNPIGSIGTQKLPESQLDRFMIKLSMGYPQIEDEVAIMKSRLENGKNTQFSACVLEKGDIEGIREEVAGIYVDDSIYEYVAKIAAKTRSRENIIQGVSPRGSIAVIAMAKAEAFLRGNNYVLPSDIKNIAVETFAHRIVTNVNGAAGTEAARKEITEILRNVPVPEMNK